MRTRLVRSADALYLTLCVHAWSDDAYTNTPTLPLDADERSDGSGSIDRDEFLQIPQIANNPLASRMIAIFDEECVSS